MPSSATAFVKNTIILTITVWMSACGPANPSLSETLADAKKFLASGQLEKAREQFEIAAKINPQNLSVAHGLAEVYERQGRLQRTYAALVHCLELAPQDQEIKKRLALSYLRAGQLLDSAAETREVLKKSPTDPEAILLFAAATPNNPNEAQAAINFLRKLPIEEKVYPPKDAAFGIIFSKLPQYYDRAEHFLQKAISEQPENPDFLLPLALLKWSQKEISSAEAYFKRALENSEPQESDTALEYSHFLKETNAPEKAIHILQNSLEHNPEHYPSLIELSNLYLEQNLHQKSIPLLETALAIDPTHHAALLLQAKLLRANGSTDLAIEKLQRLIQLYPKSTLAQLELGLALLTQGNSRAAISQLNKARTLGSKNQSIGLEMARANLINDDYQGAIIEIKNYLKKAPQEGLIWLFLADVYLEKGQVDEAMAIYSKLREQLPTNPQIPLRIGSILLLHRQLENAETAFENALALSTEPFIPALEQLIKIDIYHSDHNRALERIKHFDISSDLQHVLLYLKGTVLLSKGETDAAEASLNDAIATKPEYTLPYFSLADIEIKRFHPTKAIKYLQHVIEIEPENARAYKHLGDQLAQSKLYDQALAAYEKLVELDPNHAMALNNIAYLHSIHTKQLDKAFQFASKARLLDPNSPLIADTFAWIAYQRGDYSWALSILDDISRNTNNPTIHYHLGTCAYMLGKIELAHRALTAALACETDFDEKADALKRIAIIEAYKRLNTPESLQYLENALIQQPDDPIANLAIASHLTDQNKFERAAQMLSTILQKSPNNEEALVKLSLIEEKLGNLEKAYSLSKNVYKINPNHISNLELLCQLSAKSGEHDWTITLIERLQNLKVSTPRLEELLAYSKLACGDLAGALDSCPSQSKQLHQLLSAISKNHLNDSLLVLAQNRLNENAEDLPALLAIALNQREQDQNPQAISTFKQVLDLYPNCSFATKNLSELEAKSLTDLQE